MPPRKKFRRGRGGGQPEKQPERNDQVAHFPAPTPSGEPATPLFADQMAVKLARVERAIVRDALNYYVATVQKRIKNLRELGLPVDDMNQRIAIINGGNGLGTGIYNKLTEQMSIGDQAQLQLAQLQLEDARRAQEAEAVACRDILLKLDAMPAMPQGAIDEQLLNYVLSWSTEARQVAIEYATTVNALPEGEKFSGEVPRHVRFAIDRAIEWTMSADELRHWLAAGPYRASWWEDGDKKVWWYATVPPKTEQDPAAEPAPTPPAPSASDVADHGLFETEAEAQRCAARLNQIASLDQNLNPPTAE